MKEKYLYCAECGEPWPEEADQCPQCGCDDCVSADDLDEDEDD